MHVPIPEHETERLKELHELAILDTPDEQDFDDLALVASVVCGTPVALLSLIAQDRQWFKARVGFEARETARDIAFCAHAIVEPAGVMVIPDARSDARFEANPLVVSDPSIRFYAGAPLLTSTGNALGTLCVIDHEPRKLSAEQIGALEALSRLAVSRLETRREAMTDKLTGLGNRRSLEQQAESELSRASRAGSDVSLALFDVDRFKIVNDRLGHLNGDAVLHEMARRMVGALRAYDISGRWGGDEFIVLMPETGLEDAVAIAERVRQTMSEPFVLLDESTTTVSVSAGVVAASGSCELGFYRLLNAADGVLGDAKERGRDRIESAWLTATELHGAA